MKTNTSPPRILHHHCENSHVDLVAGLAQEARLDHSTAADLLFLGAVYIQGRRADPATRLEKGAYLRVHLKPRRFTLPDCPTEKLILASEPDFLVALKPAGLPTHATLDNQRENLLHFLVDQGPLYPVHRLDQMAHGLVLIARNAKFQTHFQRWQAQGRINKIYYCYTETAVPLGPHIHFAAKQAQPPRSMSLQPQPGDQRCELEVFCCQVQPANNHFARPHYQVQLRLLTGRTHQIRGQMSALGAPLLGDKLYGSTAPPYHPSPLQAQELHFPKGANALWRFTVPPWFVSI